MTNPLPTDLCPAGGWKQTLADGRQVVIRPLRHEDADAERAFIRALSPQARRARFLGQVSAADDALVASLTDVDQVDDVALAAVAPDAGGERIVGVARYASDATRTSCECAIVVADDWQRRGLGTALMTKLILTAQARGLQRMQSFDLAGNRDMHDLAAAFGFQVAPDPADPHQVVYALSLDAERPRTV